MSTSLTSDAPADDSAAQAPEPEAAAPVGSVDSPEVVPAERFNGLMARYNADKASAAAEAEALRAEIERLQRAEVELPAVADENVLDEVQALRSELAAERRTRLINEAVQKFPGAAPLADLIVGTNKADIEAMASELQTRLSGLSPATPADAGEEGSETPVAPAGEAPATPEAPVVGGNIALDESATADEDIANAVAAKDFSAFLRAAERRSVERESQGADLTVG